MATLFARREAKTRIRQRDWLKLAGEKIRCEQVGSVPTFLSIRANKVAKWKIGFSCLDGKWTSITTSAVIFTSSGFYKNMGLDSIIYVLATWLSSMYTSSYIMRDVYETLNCTDTR